MAEQESTGSMKGLSVVAEALRAEDFPANKEDLAYAVGDIQIQDSHHHWVPIREVLDLIPEKDFRSAEEAVRAIRAAVQQLSSHAA